jgi:hypothetical protein
MMVFVTVTLHIINLKLKDFLKLDTHASYFIRICIQAVKKLKR